MRNLCQHMRTVGKICLNLLALEGNENGEDLMGRMRKRARLKTGFAAERRQFILTLLEPGLPGKEFPPVYPPGLVDFLYLPLCRGR